MSGDAAAFRETVLWARRHGVLLGSLRVGSIEAVLTDPSAAVRVGEAADPTSVIEDYAGPTLAAAMRQQMQGDDA